jgi:L-ascorbate metabolism protein UlaG (beta-lactamase superfamily)
MMSTSRRKFLQFMGLETIGLLWTKRYHSALLPDEKISYVKNDKLRIIKESYPGNPVHDNRFVNADPEARLISFPTVLRWFLSENPQKAEKRNDSFCLTTSSISELSAIREDCMIWLGHSAFLFHIHNKWLLTDPCLTAPPFQQRHAALPLAINDLEMVDYLLISHGHFDHLDSETLGQWSNKSMKALTGLRMGPMLEGLNKYMAVQEAGWYQEFSLDESFKIYFLPAQHWNQRSLWDRNKMLWGSFLIEGNGRRIFFAGDSGYAKHFDEISELFPSVDYCLLPIGAYKPPYVMKKHHMNPEEAVRAFHDLKGKTLIPMHHGTFDLADEPLGEPLRWIRQLEAEKKINGILKTPDVGEIIYI